LEPRAQILDEHMELFWRLWYEKEPFERGEAGNAVAETLKREKLLLVFFIQHVFGFVKCFDDGLAPDHPDNFYMEREWRRLGNLHFAAADVAAVLVPPDMVDQCRRECAEYADRVQGLSRL